MSAENTDPKCCSSCAVAYAHLITRLWVALRLFMAGVDKFRKGYGDTVSFNMDNYHENTKRLADLMSSNSFLPAWSCNAYAGSIGFILLIVGVWVALGIFTEIGLFAAGLVLLSLGFGLAALPDDTEVVYIGVSVLITAAALMSARAKTFSLDALLRKKQA